MLFVSIGVVQDVLQPLEVGQAWTTDGLPSAPLLWCDAHAADWLHAASSRGIWRAIAVGSPILNIGLGAGGGGVRASANIFKAIFGTSMGYVLRGSKNGLADVKGPPSHFNWKSLGYMLRGLNGLAGGGTLNGLGSWHFW